MDITYVTVNMPIAEYEHLKEIERSLNSIIKILERANVNGQAVMTPELQQTIEDIYC